MDIEQAKSLQYILSKIETTTKLEPEIMKLEKDGAGGYEITVRFTLGKSG